MSVGLLEDLFKTFLWIIRWGFLYAVWLFVVGVEYFEISIDPSLKSLLDSIFLAILFMIISYTATKMQSLGKIYGFKNK